MHFYYGFAWDKGDFYAKNQDSFSLQTVLTGRGPAALAVICDGVGGLCRGEYASGYVAKRITTWFYEKFLFQSRLHRGVSGLKRSFQRELSEIHACLKREAEKQGIQMGTTMTVLIVYRRRYYVFHVGDSRCYSLDKKVRLLTCDQVGKKRELLYAVGVGMQPQIYFKHGRCRRKQRFLLCSDGFYRCITDTAFKALEEIHSKSDSDFEGRISRILEEVIIRGRMKGERDNCTAILLESY